ncbi:MAG TPA: thioredoxin domain-containing protein [Allosphingosinicella sp.]|jgi:protein-disulfide isomerase
MKSLLRGGAAACALLLASCGSGDAGGNASAADLNKPLAQVQAPNGDWTTAVEETAEGGFRMGNPNAKVKLVEYGSLGCGHCAEFAETATEKLRDTYVKSGQVSWEFRPFLLFPTDPGVSQLLKCQGPAPFFRTLDTLYAEQGDWMGKLQSMSPEQQQQLQSMAPAQRSATLIQAMGLDQFFRQRGMPEARINACLADAAGLEALANITKRATEQEGVTGTPTFFINGKIIENANTWQAIEPQLRGAIG